MLRSDHKSDKNTQTRWRHYIPATQMEELHECVTLLCLFFAYGFGALVALFLVVVTFIVAIVLLVRRVWRYARATKAATQKGDAKKKLA